MSFSLRKSIIMRYFLTPEASGFLFMIHTGDEYGLVLGRMMSSCKSLATCF
ncbi:unnamed protein product [Acanthoscelides obtectus]|uniref:Uncharacterized protein n=1 Tax=Acanthoscelides obtectus TaxID=200917 RepID=A0A9P0NYH4_ACAOB|nr:unnamed protein product [Acanthoscelides obtectus]CAK1663680.1 hypothetical protein AOBTE_LOCUS23795 [Acanthoscelides obtectus]